MQYAGRVADDGVAGGYVPDHDRTGTDIGVSADTGPRDHAGPSPEKGAFVDGNVPGQMNAGTESREIRDPVVVCDGRSRIHEDVSAETRIRRDRGMAEDHRSLTNCAARADQHGRIDDRGETRTDGLQALDCPGPGPGFAQRHDEAEGVVAREIVDLAGDRTIVELVGGRDVRVDEAADKLDVTTDRLQPWENDQDLARQRAGSEQNEPFGL